VTAHQVADAGLGDLHQFRRLRLRQPPTRHQVLDGRHKPRTQFQVLGLLIRERKVFEYVVRRLKHLYFHRLVLTEVLRDHGQPLPGEQT
jgi:hypothetical protein